MKSSAARRIPPAVAQTEAKASAGKLGWLGIPVQRWRQLTQGSFFLLFILAPVFDIFRLDLNLKHFIFFGLDWTLGLDDFLAGRASAAHAALNIVLRGFLPLLAVGGTLIFVSWKWGRLYCGWLCPHFSIVETINQTLRRAIGKQSLWDAKPLPARNPDGTDTRPDAVWWFAVVPLTIPLLTGPASMSTVVIYADRAQGVWQTLALVGYGVVIALATAVCFALADPIARVLGKTGINVMTRLMGLILAALAVEVMADGLGKIFPVLIAR